MVELSILSLKNVREPGRTFIATLDLNKVGFRNTLTCSIAYSNVLHQYIYIYIYICPFF